MTPIKGDDGESVAVSYNVACDARGCRASEPIKNTAAAAAAFDGGPDWIADPSWFPEGWRAVRVRLTPEMKRIYGTARLSELVAAGTPVGNQPVIDSFWTFTLCSTHKEADPVLRDVRHRADDGGEEGST